MSAKDYIRERFFPHMWCPGCGHGIVLNGNIDQAFDVVELSRAAGATFVARTSVYHVRQMIEQIKKAIIHRGFSVVDIMSQCPTYFGRKNKLGSAVDMMKYFKERTTAAGSEAKKENPSLIERGIMVEKELPEYCEEYNKIIALASSGGARPNAA